MKLKTKSFFWGTATGIALTLFLGIGLTETHAAESVPQQETEAEQMQRFGSTCQDALSEALSYFNQTLSPALKALREGRFYMSQLPNLTAGVESQRKFLSYCATHVVSIQDRSSLKLSNRLMSASEELSDVFAYLNSIRLSACDPICQRDLIRRATEASAKFENILRER